jgi:hypothetical protein
MKYGAKIAVCNPYHIEEMFMIYGDVDGLLNWFKQNDKSWQSLPEPKFPPRQNQPSAGVLIP